MYKESNQREQEIFSWSGWDGDSECMIFYNPVLKVQIGNFPIVTKFDMATIVQNCESKGNYLQLANYSPENEKGHSPEIFNFEIHMVVGKQVK